MDMFEILAIAAHIASKGNSTLEGLHQDIDPNRAPKNFKDAMSSKNQQEWVTALNKEYMGIKDSNAFAIVKLPTGARTLGTQTRWEYKKDASTLVKYKERMVVRGDHQVKGESSTS